MAYSISNRLHDLLKPGKKLTLVAQEMGQFNGQKISIELRPHIKSAKLGADDLVPLFRAMRAVGMEAEADGLLQEFIRELKSDAPAQIDDDPTMLYVELQRAMAAATEAASRLLEEPTENDLVDAINTVSTRLMACLMRVEAVLESRLDSMRKGDIK